MVMPPPKMSVNGHAISRGPKCLILSQFHSRPPMLDLEPFLGAILSICWGVPTPKMSVNGHTIFRRAHKHFDQKTDLAKRSAFGKITNQRSFGNKRILAKKNTKNYHGRNLDPLRPDRAEIWSIVR